MIIGSIGFVLVAAGLLVAGLLNGDELYYYLSIVSSALAALALVVGVRQIAATRSIDDDFDARPVAGRRPGPVVGRVVVPLQLTAGPVPDEQRAAAALSTLPAPPDEPPAQFVTPIEADRVGKLSTEVAVIDGRPRYHLTECVHLAGREYERLPVKEAVALGFTPCGGCEPVAVLLAGSLRP